jgi:hypothetical protein
MRNLPHVRHRPRQWSAFEYTATRIIQQVCEREPAFVSPSRTSHGDTLVRIPFRPGTAHPDIILLYSCARDGMLSSIAIDAEM